jgi:hypothetical protein
LLFLSTIARSRLFMLWSEKSVRCNVSRRYRHVYIKNQRIVCHENLRDFVIASNFTSMDILVTFAQSSCHGQLMEHTGFAYSRPPCVTQNCRNTTPSLCFYLETTCGDLVLERFLRLILQTMFDPYSWDW